MCRNMFLALSIIGCAILAPVHLSASSNIKSENGVWLLSLTPKNLGEKGVIAQVIVAYLANITVAGFLWWNYRKVVALRRAYFDTEEYQQSLHARTLMLVNLPKQGASDEGIARIIDQVVPNSSFARTVVARNVKDLPNLISQHDHAVRKLEKVLAKYLKNPNQLPPGRPTCNPSRKDRARDTYTKGQKLDAIEYYTQRIRQLELEIQSVRQSVDRRSTMPYGFASYADIAETHSIAYACRNKKPHGATIRLAPRPNDIIWKNMALTPAARSRSRWLNSFWIFLLTLLWIAPNAMIAIFLVNLNNLGNFWPAFGDSLEDNPNAWGIVQGILSPAIMSLVYLVLPMIFRRLQIKAGDRTKTGRERHVTGKLFAFFVFNNLIIFTLFSVVATFVSSIINQNKNLNAWDLITEEHLADKVLDALCNNSPFWVTYLLQRQLGAAIDLAQLWPLIQAFFLKRFSSPTPREMIDLTAPPPFEYASYYNYFLFYAAVTLCYSGIQPIVLPATALYFTIDYWLKKYLLLYRFVTKTESGGVFWRVLFNRVLFSAMLADLVFMLTCWCKSPDENEVLNRPMFWAVVPLPFLLIGFKIYCGKAFDDKLQYYSTSTTQRHPEHGIQKEDRHRGDRLASRFGQPALYKKLITPMVHQKAQNLLPAVYKGRLTDGREEGADDLVTVSGYSDMFALNNMQGGKPGKAANDVPGFEYVAESQMDFEYYKNRAEFTEEHGEIYGRAGEAGRPNTPGSFGEGSDSGSRPGTPNSPRMGGRRAATNPMDTSYQPFRQTHGRDFTAPPSVPEQGVIGSQGGMDRNRSPLYTQDNGSLTGLVHNAAAPPVSSVGPNDYRHGSMDTDITAPSITPGGRVMPTRSTSPGPSLSLGGGPRGYTGLAQHEYDSPDGGDPTQYDYFRGGSKGRRNPGQGW